MMSIVTERIDLPCIHLFTINKHALYLDTPVHVYCFILRLCDGYGFAFQFLGKKFVPLHFSSLSYAIEYMYESIMV